MLDGLLQPPRKPLGPPGLEIQDQVTRKPTASFERPSSSNRADYGFLWPFSWGKYMGTWWFTIEFGSPRPRFQTQMIPVSRPVDCFKIGFLLLLMICLVLMIWSKRRPFWARPWQPYIVCYWGLGKLMSPGNRRNQCFAAGFMASLDLVGAQLGKNNNLELLKQVGPPVLHQVSPSFTKFHLKNSE